MLRIDEDDNSHYVYIKCCKQTFICTKRVYFAISLTFANIVIMVFGTQEVFNKHYDKGCMEVEGQQILKMKQLKFKHHFNCTCRFCMFN